MMTIDERIAAWLAAVPGAISGAGGHNQTFRVACQLYNGWALDEQEALRWLERYNERCQPPWTPAELKHKAANAAKAKHAKPRGHLARDEARFQTTPVPIQLPATDTRAPVRGELEDAKDASLCTPPHFGKTFPRAYARRCQKYVSSVFDGWKNEQPTGEKSSESVLSVFEEQSSVDDAWSSFNDVERFLEEAVNRKKGAIVAFHYLLARYRAWRKGYGLLKTDFDETAFALAVQSHGIATNLQRKLFFDVCTQQYRHD